MITARVEIESRVTALSSGIRQTLQAWSLLGSIALLRSLCATTIQPAARNIIHLVKEHANHGPVIVRTEDDRDYDVLILSERRGYYHLRSDKSAEVA
ncbi:MAG: hypothetical protein EBT08_07330 [Betaproteobacteria bacterium]|nr:hypothetical protein [Betaproteobacteria bacterium]